jgi:hypothetical protein
VHPLQQRIEQVRHGHNRRALVEMGCWGFVSAVAIVVAIGAADYLLRTTDTGLRVLLSLTLLAAVGVTIWRLLRWWRRERWTELSTAQQVQRAYPQLGDRLASALEFLRQEEDDPTAGSAPLRRAVVAEATSTLELLPASEVSQRLGAKRAIVAAVATLVVVGTLAMFAPATTRTAVTRLIAPWNRVEWPRRNDLVFIDPPTLLARGDTFEVSVEDSTGTMPSDVAIEYRYIVDGRPRTERNWMQRVGNTMVARRENVRRSFEYRATGGDHHSMAWTKVSVVDRPTVSELQLTIVPPAYTGLPIAEVKKNSRVLSGSTMDLSATASEPLANATLIGGDGDKLSAIVSGPDATNVELPKGSWTAKAESTTRPTEVQLLLTSKAGLTGEVSLPAFEVVADRPPVVAWTSPSEDLQVVASARIPFAATVSDDLAIADVKLDGKLAPLADAEASPALEVELFRGPAQPPGRSAMPADGEQLETLEVQKLVDLTDLKLSAGQVLEVTISAGDYLPQRGKADTARRITILTAAELDSRIASDQAEILRLLEQALADERLARQQTQATSTSDMATPAALDGLLNSRLTQQQVRRTLAEKESGVLDRVRALLDRLSINGVASAELVAELDHIAAVVTQLNTGALAAAEQQLTDLRKAVEANSSDPALPDSFTAVDGTQQQIVETLEALIDRAQAWSDAERFVREIARLEQDELELRERSLDALRRTFEARTDRNVQPPDATEVERLAADQAELAQRFDKLAQAMRDMASSETASSEMAGKLSDALNEADTNNLSAQLADAARDLASEQFGRAGETQQSAAEVLREMVDRLRDRAPTDPGELASRLRQLQSKLDQLGQQADQAESEPNEAAQAEQRNELAKQLAQLSRELNRLTAQAAGQSTQQASSSAAPKPGESKENARQDMKQSKEQIEQAKRDLAQRIAELEGERQQRLLDRLAEVLDGLIPRQQQTLEQTLKLEVAKESAESSNQTAEASQSLAEAETRIAGELQEAMLDVEKRAVFQLALGGAAAEMRQAAEALAADNTGRVTQNLELTALARMRHVLEILRDPPPPPPEGEESPGGGGQGGGNQPQQPPLIELAEAKMLRWLQTDLNSRTRLFEADLADNSQAAAQKREAANRLAAEQQQLEELVREMMRRNNRNMQRPVDL